jgi:hypothetical protein
MKQRVVTLIVLSLLLVGANRASATSILSSQAANFTGGTVFGSQNDPSPGGLGNFGTVYDNFVLGFDSEVTDLHWTGGYFTGGAGTITAFTIAFYADAGGQPGSSLLGQTVAGTAGETFLGNDFFGPVFTYSLILPTSFLATGGTTYWLSIVPTITFPPQWGWYTSAGGDALAFHDFLGNRSLAGTSFAFDLTGDINAIPEPLSLTLLGTGVVGMIGRRIHQRRRTKGLSNTSTK